MQVKHISLLIFIYLLEQFVKAAPTSWLKAKDMKFASPSVSTESEVEMVESKEAAWKSMPVTPKSEESTYIDVTFKKPERLHTITFTWINPSEEFWIISTVDEQNWKAIFHGTMNVGADELAKPSVSIDQVITLAHSTFAKAIKIVLQKPLYPLFALNALEVYLFGSPMMLYHREVNQKDKCLIVQDGEYKIGRRIYAASCVDAVALNDGRELFIMTEIGLIKTIEGEMCLAVEDGKVQAGNNIEIMPCSQVEDLNDGRGAFVMAPGTTQSEMKMRLGEKLCIGIKSTVSLRDLKDIKVGATSESIDGKHKPIKVLDKEKSSYWSSNPGAEHVEFTLTFAQVNAKSLSIIWKNSPREYWLYIYANGVQRLFEHVTKNRITMNKYDMFMTRISGIKLVMKKFQSENPKDQVYGIVDIQLETSLQKVKLVECSSNNEPVNFLADEAEYQVITPGKNFINTKKVLNLDQNRLDDLQGKLKNLPPKLVGAKETEKELVARLAGLSQILKEIDKNLTNFRSSFLKEFEQERMKNMLKASLGANYLRPVEDCYVLLKVYPYKRNGFYWIKTHCMENPMKIYCDLNSTMPASLFYLGGFGTASATESKFDTTQDIRKQCAMKGMKPFEIKDTHDVDEVLLFIHSLPLQILMNQVIPLAYDYGCDARKCKEQYISLNSPNSKDVSNMWTTVMIKQNGAPSADSGKGKEKHKTGPLMNALGIGKGRYKFTTFDLFDEELNRKGVLCSTNFKASDDNKESWILAKCNTIARGNSDFDAPLFTNIKIKCPGGCLEDNTAVFGSGIYKDDSSICRAAIHRGIINPMKGGYVEVGIEEGKDKYSMSTANGVSSQEFASPWERSFVLNSYHWGCPIDDFKEDIMRFRFKQIGNILRKTQRRVFSRQRVLNPIKGYSFKEALAKLASVSKASEDKPGVIAEQPLPALNLEDINSSSGKEPAFFTKELMTSLEAIQESMKGDILQELKYTLIYDAFIKTETVKDDKIIEGMLGPESSYRIVEAVDGKFYEIQTKSGENMNDQMTILNQKKIDKKKLQIMKGEISMFNDFSEDFKNFDLNWEAFSYQGILGIADWKITKGLTDIYPVAVHLASNVTNIIDHLNRYASIAVLKYKRYYDFHANISVYVKNEGMVGIMFRFLDPFNHYSFDIVRKESQVYVQVRKVVHGRSVVLAFLQDKGILENQWYKIRLGAKKHKFVIKVEKDKGEGESDGGGAKESGGGEDNNPRVLDSFQIQVIDYELTTGTVALASDEREAFFANIVIKPLECVDEEGLENENTYAPPTASRFRDTMLSKIATFWEIIDPLLCSGCPSVWSYVDNFKGIPKVLMQESTTFSLSTAKEPAILLLKKPKEIFEGYVFIDFMAMEKGIIGLIFKYANIKNYLMFEIADEIRGNCRMRAMINGDTTQASQDVPGCFYRMGVWHTMMMKVDFTKIQIFYFETISEVPQLVFEHKNRPGFNTPVLGNQIGISTYGTRAAFKNIMTFPLDDYQKLSIEIPIQGLKKKDGNQAKAKDGRKEKEEEKPKEEIKPKKKGFFGIFRLKETNSHSQCQESNSQTDVINYPNLSLLIALAAAHSTHQIPLVNAIEVVRNRKEFTLYQETNGNTVLTLQGQRKVHMTLVKVNSIMITRKSIAKSISVNYAVSALPTYSTRILQIQRLKNVDKVALKSLLKLI